MNSLWEMWCPSGIHLNWKYTSKVSASICILYSNVCCIHSLWVGHALVHLGETSNTISYVAGINTELMFPLTPDIKTYIRNNHKLKCVKVAIDGTGILSNFWLWMSCCPKFGRFMGTAKYFYCRFLQDSPTWKLPFDPMTCIPLVEFVAIKNQSSKSVLSVDKSFVSSSVQSVGALWASLKPNGWLLSQKTWMQIFSPAMASLTIRHVKYICSIFLRHF